jgi:hypothetical protein
VKFTYKGFAAELRSGDCFVIDLTKRSLTFSRFDDVILVEGHTSFGLAQDFPWQMTAETVSCIALLIGLISGFTPKREYATDTYEQYMLE